MMLVLDHTMMVCNEINQRDSQTSILIDIGGFSGGGVLTQTANFASCTRKIFFQSLICASAISKCMRGRARRYLTPGVVAKFDRLLIHDKLEGWLIIHDK